ncbi:MAG: valine--tRNA ligase [Lachnospirales bacterium]
MAGMAKNFQPQEAENRIFNNWMEKKYFNGDVDKSKKPFSIIQPPPNITGQLHMGHALDNTYQDVLIRTKRMQGYNALWLPGTDHASISTEVKIVQKMASEGITKADITREEFLVRAWEWKEEYGNIIVEQVKRIGCSCDYDKERFTMDEGNNKAVTEVFINLYNKGYVYRGEKLINWCPHCKTTISDAEVDHEDVDGAFYHMTYKVKETGEMLEFATTRPETILGDTAIAVHPEDEKYKHLVGKTVTVPIVNREIPIIADEYVEMDFGTGVVKITPAHDPNDFEVGARHNLEIINIMNDDGTMNENSGVDYNGLDRYEARKKIVEDFDRLGQFVKKKEITHAVGKHERCKTVIEPLIKLQWFVKMEELAKPALEVYKNEELKFIPSRFGKVYENWLSNIHDWCISRQLWWGHRIPVFYCNDCDNFDVSSTEVTTCSKCGSTNVVQDEDTLDTWFSSALWPFTTMGWPDKTEMLEHFYPTDVLVTGYDIIFFWVVRMVFSGLEHMGEKPFSDVLIHGLVRDEQGRKMSKSLGNGIDPLEIIDQYGADVLRATLLTGCSTGNDTRFIPSKLDANRNFMNKLWNASRFVLMNIEDESLEGEYELTPSDKWILSRVNQVTKEVTENIDKYELGLAFEKVLDFVWEEYCDWYIEMVKPRLYNKEDETRLSALVTLKEVLIKSLKLLHPFMPFVTEEIFMNIQDEEETIMLSSFPVFDENNVYEKEVNEIELFKNAIKEMRNVRSQMNVPPSKKTSVYVVSEDDFVTNTFKDGMVFFKTLGYASEVYIQSNNDGIDSNAVSVVIENGTIYIPFAELVDMEKEIERLEGEKKKLLSEVDRVVKKLSNENFVSKAPEKVINEEKAKKEKYENMLEKVVIQLENLQK